MDCVLFSTINWDTMDGAHQPVRWARELVARGHRVLYVQAQPFGQRPTCSNPVVVSLTEIGLTEAALRLAWLDINPGDLTPFVSRILSVIDAFESKGAGARLAIWSDPFVPFVLPLRALRERGYYTIYNCKDDFRALWEMGYYFGNREAERLLVRECDLIVTLSEAMAANLRQVEPDRDIRLLHEGVDLTEFQSSETKPFPSDLVRGAATLGFWGLVNDFNIDVALLLKVARARPEWSINLIGPVDSDPARALIADQLRACTNIHLLGQKPHADLVNYLAGCDVMLIPYPLNEYNLSRDPIKVFEYLAGGKPVVATHAPQLGNLPHVAVANTAEEFLVAVDRALSCPIDRSRLDAYLATCTWSMRIDTLLKWIAETPPQNVLATPVTVDSFYTAISLTANLSAYAHHAEALLKERDAYIHQVEGEAARTQEYIRRLESTHPGIWAKHLLQQLMPGKRSPG